MLSISFSVTRTFYYYVLQSSQVKSCNMRKLLYNFHHRVHKRAAKIVFMHKYDETRKLLSSVCIEYHTQCVRLESTGVIIILLIYCGCTGPGCSLNPVRAEPVSGTSSLVIGGFSINPRRQLKTQHYLI